jgi:hypothetical protein
MGYDAQSKQMWVESLLPRISNQDVLHITIFLKCSSPDSVPVTEGPTDVELNLLRNGIDL